MFSVLARCGAVCAAGALVWLAGCQQPQHTIAESQVQSKVINCTLCYDRAVTVRKMSPKGSWLGQRQTVVKHMCQGNRI